MDIRADLLERAARFCEAKGTSISALGREVIGEPRFFARLQKGGSFTVRTYERFLEHFKAHEKDAA